MAEDNVVAGSLEGFKTSPPEWTALDTLNLDLDNPNFHTEDDLGPTGRSLAAFGQVETLCADKKSRRIISGNGRYLKLVESKVTHAWVIFVEGTEPQLRALAIAVNQTGRNSDFNWAVLTRQLQELDAISTVAQPLLELTALPQHLIDPALSAEHLMPELSAGGVGTFDTESMVTPPTASERSGKLGSRGLTIQFTLAQREVLEEMADVYNGGCTVSEMLYGLVEDFKLATLTAE